MRLLFFCTDISSLCRWIWYHHSPSWSWSQWWNYWIPYLYETRIHFWTWWHQFFYSWSKERQTHRFLVCCRYVNLTIHLFLLLYKLQRHTKFYVFHAREAVMLCSFTFAPIVHLWHHTQRWMWMLTCEQINDELVWC